MKRIAILGAGPMGLILAHFLRDKGEVTVFEADDRPGGMSASFNFDGVTLERYYHFINTPDIHTLTLLRELDLANILRWRATTMGFYTHNRLYPWGTALSLLRFDCATFTTRLRYGLHALACLLLRDPLKLDGESAQNWISRFEGQEGYEIFWHFLLEKKFFEHADSISAAWLATRIHRVGTSRSPNGPVTGKGSTVLGYLEGGTVVLVNRLVDTLTNSGGKLYLNAPVLALDPLPEGGAVVTTPDGTERFDTVVSTMPLPILTNVAPKLPQAWIAKASGVRTVGCRCALFRLGHPCTQNFWTNVDVTGCDAPGIIEYSNLRPLGNGYAYVPFYMPRSHPNWSLSDEELLSKARSCLKMVDPDAADTEEACHLFTCIHAQFVPALLPVTVTPTLLKENAPFNEASPTVGSAVQGAAV